MVCKTDGTAVAESRKGWVHIGEIVAGTEDHDIEVVTREEFEAGVVKQSDVKMLAAALMRHHLEFHPDPACPWVAQLTAAFRSAVG